jgi:hypothetical protein
MTNLGEVLSNINQGEGNAGCAQRSNHRVLLDECQSYQGGGLYSAAKACYPSNWRMLGGRLEASEPSERTLYITFHERLEPPSHSSLVPGHHDASCQAVFQAVRGE